MNPVLTATLTLTGVLAAGAPLFWLTASPTVQKPEPLPVSEARQEEVYAVIQFSGEPESITLRYQGQTLAEYKAPAGSIDTTLSLPEGAAGELEAEAHWPESETGAQALTITLERSGREPHSCTRWGEGIIHDIFTYAW